MSGALPLLLNTICVGGKGVRRPTDRGRGAPADVSLREAGLIFSVNVVGKVPWLGALVTPNET